MADETGRTKDFTKGIAANEVGDGVIVGLLVGDTVRCPWHHACFSLRTGGPVRAPSLDPVDCWRIEQQGDMRFVRQKLEAAPKSSSSRDRSLWPESVVIIGGGAGGLAAADVLRREGYDRPNLSKDYLAGTAQVDWIPLRAPEFYTNHFLRIGLLVASFSVA
jgi:apoptosis-inducing factor 3